jgi:hypothetical protein
MKRLTIIGAAAIAALAMASSGHSQPGLNIAEDAKAAPPGPPPITENPASIEAGVYMCVSPDMKGPSKEPTPFAVNIQDESNYLLYTNNGAEKEPGSYGFADGVVTWTSGPMKSQPAGKYEGDPHAEPSQMRLQIQPAGAPLMSCYMYDGPA